MQILDALVKKGVLQADQRNALQQEVEKSGKTEEEVLLEQNTIPEEEIFQIKSAVTNIPLFKPNPDEVPTEVLELISEEVALNYKMIPLFRKGEVVGIGMVYPENMVAQNALRFLSRKGNFKYEIHLITFTDLNNLLKLHRNLKRETTKALSELNKEQGDVLQNLAGDLDNAQVTDEEAPIIKMVLVILRHAIDGNASDIHVEPSREKLNVRFRQDGALHLSLFLPLNVHRSIVSRIKILANLKIDETRIPQDGRFSAKINNKDIDFRVATFPTLYGEKVEIRVLNPAEGLRSLEKMGLAGRNFQVVQQAIQKPSGLIVVSGPTGSGKTTTLYGLMHMLNKEDVNMVTIEDPIEYSMDGVNQSQIKPEIGYTFSEGLRQILRQDPDIIMVGEIRDEETASLVIHAALTGHVVLSTLHTNSAVSSLVRLIDMGIKPFLLPSTVKIIINQRLVRTLCEKCKKKVEAAQKVKDYLAATVKTLPAALKKGLVLENPVHVYEANGCSACNFKGYRGRVGLFEVVSMDDAMAEIIMKNPSEKLLWQAAKSQGMTTMAQEGALKVLSGETTIDEIMRVSEDEY